MYINSIHEELYGNGTVVIFGNGTRKYYQDGWLHREDGAAIEWKNGDKEYYIDGKGLSKKEYEMYEFICHIK